MSPSVPAAPRPRRPAPARTARRGTVLLERMRTAARRSPALARLNILAADDVSVVLIEAWSQVLDVLGFYQDRIADEGYVASAAEAMSLYSLAQQVGVSPVPAQGAATFLSLQLTAAGKRAGRVPVTPGQSLVVQNVPAAGAQPVVFECDEAADLDAAWNALPAAPDTATVAQVLRPTSRSLRVLGTDTGIRAGQALLIEVAPPPAPVPPAIVPAGPTATRWLVTVDLVRPDRRTGSTLVTWEDAIGDAGSPAWSRPIFRLTSYAQATGLLGQGAPAWADVPAATRAALGVRQGGLLTLTPDPDTGDRPLPIVIEPWVAPLATGDGSAPLRGSVQALAGHGDYGLWAGTDAGLFQSGDAGRSWRQVALPLGRHSVTALANGASGLLYVGTATGRTFASFDAGETWTSLPVAVASPVPPVSDRWRHWFDGEGEAGTSWTLAGAIHAIAELDPYGATAPTVAIGVDGGVFTLTLGDLTWQPSNHGLEGVNKQSGAIPTAATALAVSGGGILVAIVGTLLVRRAAAAAPWVTIALPSGHEPTCLVNDVGRRTLFVGTTGGVFAISKEVFGTPLPFSFGLPRPLPGVRAMTASPGLLWAATGDGIFVSSDELASWSIADTQELALFVADAALAPGMGTGTGGVSDDLRARFMQFGIALARTVEVETLAGPRSGWELRDVADGQMRRFRLYLDLASPSEMAVVQRLRNLAGAESRLAYADGRVFAAVPFGAVLDRDWPGMSVGGDALLLDRRATAPDPGGDLVIVDGSATGPTLDPDRYAVRRSETLRVQAFGGTSIVTRVAIVGAASLAQIDARTARVYLSSRTQTPFEAVIAAATPVAGASLTIAGDLGGIPAGRAMQVTGPRSAAIVLDPATPAFRSPSVAQAPVSTAAGLDQGVILPMLTAAMLAAGVKLSVDAAATCVEPGGRWFLRDGDQAWRIDAPPGEGPAAAAEQPSPAMLAISATPIMEVLEEPASATGEWLLALPGEQFALPAAGATVVRQAATSWQQPVVEVVHIASLLYDPAVDTTTIALRSPLRNGYDPFACRLCANVVRMTQGETVGGEILGGGTGRAFQALAPLRSPLTYVGGRGSPVAPALLELAVDGRRAGTGGALAAVGGARWRPVATLADAGPDDAVFEVRQDATGGTRFRFGDGVNGARLPLGTDNVAASYRVGAGAAGNVAAGTLTVLRKRPPAVRSATNPLPATAGCERETPDALRARLLAAAAVGDDRIVTLDDYQRFARGFGGVGAAVASYDADAGPGGTVRIVATGDPGAPVGLAPATRDALAAAIRARRADSTELSIVDPLVISWEVTITIATSPDAEPGRIMDDARRTLLGRFGSDRPIGEPLSQAGILAVATSVAGVERADLLQLVPLVGPRPTDVEAGTVLHLLTAVKIVAVSQAVA